MKYDKTKIVPTKWGDWNYESFKHFKKLYEEATALGATEFTAQGQKVLVSFAKYLIEYLESEFKIN